MPCALAGAAVVVFQNERWIAADLADSGQFGENLKSVPAEIRLAPFAHICFHADDLPVVELSLFCFHSGITDFLEFFGKVAQDVLLAPAQDKRRDHTAQALHGFLIFEFNCRLFNVCLKARIGI